MEKTDVLILTVVAAPAGIMSNSLRSFLHTISGVEVTAQATSLAQTERALTRSRPHLLLLDADLPGPGLAPCVAQFRAQFPTLSIIVLAAGQPQQETAVGAGANYALLKGSLDHQLRRAIITPTNITGYPEPAKKDQPNNSKAACRLAVSHTNLMKEKINEK